MVKTVLNPMLRLNLVFLWHIQSILKLVTTSVPLSPLLPFVSSTEFMLSIIYSPLRFSRFLPAVIGLVRSEATKGRLLVIVMYK